MVYRERHCDDLNVVSQALREERSQWSVDEPAHQNGLFRRSSASLHEAAGDLSDGVLSLFVVANERQEVEIAGVFGHRCDAQDDGFAHAEENGAACLLSNATRLEGERLSAHLKFVVVNHFSVSCAAQIRVAVRNPSVLTAQCRVPQNQAVNGQRSGESRTGSIADEKRHSGLNQRSGARQDPHGSPVQTQKGLVQCA